VSQVTSSDINTYLRDIAEADVSAKDFRTWAGTVLAAMALKEFDEVDSETAAKRNVKAAIATVAARLGNTPTICRKCYVHPEILESYVDGSLAETIGQKVKHEIRALSALSAEEAATLALLHDRLKTRRAAGKTRKRGGACAH
jgi:DNA topoisomerase-1